MIKMRFIAVSQILLISIIVSVWIPVTVPAISMESFSEDPVTIKTYASLSSLPQGGSMELAVELVIDSGWHINANKVNDPYMIPTSIIIESVPGLTVEKVVYPRGIEKTLSFSESPLPLYSRRALIGILIKAAPSVSIGEAVFNAAVTYQACDDKRCLAPIEKKIDIRVTVSSPKEAVDARFPEIFASLNLREDAGNSGAGSSGENISQNGQARRLQNLMKTRGLPFVLLIIFMGGLALDLTPCVYPVIPITVSYFGGQSEGRSAGTFLLASLYVLGMAAMYSSLGLAAALTGSMFGTALQNMYVLFGVALIMVLLALSMFGLYELRIPASISAIAGTSKQGPIGAFLMGLTVGIVAAPCIGPFVLGLLTFVGETGNPALGFLLFFTLALGLGLPFMVLAVLSGSISRLPRSGEWMEWVRKMFGVVLLAMAVYFLESVLGSVTFYLLLGLLLATSGIILGFVLKSSTQGFFFNLIRKLTGLAVLLFGLYLLFAPGHIFNRNETGGIAWQEFNRDLLTKAAAGKKPVMIDFFADWCLPCKELDHRTFSRSKVIDASRKILALKADLTRSASPEVIAIKKFYKIKGVPTVVFIDGQGKERQDLRVFGFVGADDFTGRLERLKGPASK